MAIIKSDQIISLPDQPHGIVRKEVSISYIQYDSPKCDGCGAELKDVSYGKVCPECGLESQEKYTPLQYDRPYDDNKVQYAPLGNTQIGTARERLCNSHSTKLEKLNKLQSIKDNDKVVLDEAKREISRIFESLGLPKSLKDIAFSNLKEFRAKLGAGTKYRSAQNLVPVSIYYTFKSENASINEGELLEVSKISKKDFNSFKLMINDLAPEYKFRKRKEYILQKVSEVQHTFNLPMEFYFQAKKILYKLWEDIKNTKDDVVAGLVSSISVLCSFPEKVTINSVCKRLGIKMSTIQSQVKKNIFAKLKEPNFISLVKSANILKKIMQKLGIIGIENTIVGVQFGNATQTFNHYDNAEYYFFVLHDVNKSPIPIVLEKYKPDLETSSDMGNKTVIRGVANIVSWLAPAKGPPLIIT